MGNVSRRLVLGGLAMPGLVRAQSVSKPIRLGLLSNLTGPFADAGGVGNRIAAELAVADFGGSVLGRPVEVLQTDATSATAREWIDAQDLSALADGGGSATGLAVQQIARQKTLPYLITGPADPALTGAQCSPYGFHFVHDTYALARNTGAALTRTGGNTWYFITIDDPVGHAVERETAAAVRATGGALTGTIRIPPGTADVSGYLAQARGSGAKVIGLAGAGEDLKICIRQAANFNLARSGIRPAAPLTAVSDIAALGHKTCEGLVYADSFYWNLNDSTRAFTKSWALKSGGMVPGSIHAGNYSATLHWLKAVRDAGTVDADVVAAKMRAAPVNDFYNSSVRIRSDGRVMHQINLWQVKPAASAKSKYDFNERLAVIPGDEAWRPMRDGGCPLANG